MRAPGDLRIGVIGEVRAEWCRHFVAWGGYTQGVSGMGNLSVHNRVADRHALSDRGMRVDRQLGGCRALQRGRRLPGYGALRSGSVLQEAPPAPSDVAGYPTRDTGDGR